MTEVPGGFMNPNAGAYEKEEMRTGPPLTYVGEKLRTALEHIHSLSQSTREWVPSDLPLPPRVSQDFGTKRERLERVADGAFYQALVAFLALYNSIGRLGEWEIQQQKIQALREMTRQEFSAWLDSVEGEGSVTG